VLIGIAQKIAIYYFGAYRYKIFLEQ